MADKYTPICSADLNVTPMNGHDYVTKTSKSIPYAIIGLHSTHVVYADYVWIFQLNFGVSRKPIYCC